MLKKCKECEKEISHTAMKCPNCACIDPCNTHLGAGRKGAKGCLIVFLGLILFIVFIVLIVPSEDPDAWKTKDNSITAISTVQIYIQKKLDSPGPVEFPTAFSEGCRIIHLGNQIYRVTSYFDSQNAFGVMVRTRYIAEVQVLGNYDGIVTSFKLK